eukprot:s1736_g12.t1
MSGQGDAGGSVPVWDGAARSWRRYTKEVAWYVQSTAPHKRRHCASRLMGKLSGPARLLAMSWSHAAFDTEDGTRKLLQRLASSPRVRKTLPNAAAICQQYFSFRRQVNESIGNFLVRETLVHEEFQEAIIRLHEEKMGVTQESKDFGLPPVQEESWGDDAWGGTWESWWNYDEDYVDEDRSGEPPVGDDPPEGLWDEQLLGQKYHSAQHSQAYYMNSDDMEAYYHDYHDDWYSQDDDWSEGYVYCNDYENTYEDPWWHGEADYGYQATADDGEPIDDEKYKEAKQAEKVAESLALEAQRTWSDAQKATQALRRDRGFGAMGSKGASSGGKWFPCGGNHFIRDCPMKGKGKERFYMADTEDYGMHYAGKGKSQGKGKGKGKSGLWLEGYAAWKGKGKSKFKGKDPTRAVNAYHASAEPYSLHGLDLTSTMEAASMTSTALASVRWACWTAVPRLLQPPRL